MTDNTPKQIYINKIGNIITFRIKTGYYLELLTSETMKLLESTKNKVNKDKNSKNALQLEVTEVLHC